MLVNQNNMKTHLLLLMLFIICISTNAQELKIFYKHSKAINAIVSKGQLAYYIGDGKAGTNSKIKLHSIQKSGQVNVFDSICNNHKPNKCICQKQTPSFNLLAIYNFDIKEGYMYLRDINKQCIGRIYGLRSEDLYQLKPHFMALRVWCITYVEKEQAVKQAIIKERDDLPNPKNNAKKIALQQAIKQALQKK